MFDGNQNICGKLWSHFADKNEWQCNHGKPRRALLNALHCKTYVIGLKDMWEK